MSPLVLAFDCSGSACSVALATRDDKQCMRTLAHDMQTMQRGHAAALVPMIQATLNDARVRPRDLDLVAVTTGPGSFTGVRIGLSTARGLALALDVPLAGLSTIQTLLHRAEDGRAHGHRVMAAIDTHRGDYYIGFGDRVSPLVADVDRIAARIGPSATFVVGDGAATLCTALQSRGIVARADEASVFPDPVSLAALAMLHTPDVWRARNAELGMPRPLYLRQADVTMSRSSG